MQAKLEAAVDNIKTSPSEIAFVKHISSLSDTNRG